MWTSYMIVKYGPIRSASGCRAPKNAEAQRRVIDVVNASYCSLLDARGRTTQGALDPLALDIERNRVPRAAVHILITYKFQELTNAGLPRFPVFMRVRPTE